MPIIKPILGVIMAGSPYATAHAWWLMTAASGAFIPEHQLPTGIVNVQPEVNVVWSASGLGIAQTGSYFIYIQTSKETA